MIWVLSEWMGVGWGWVGVGGQASLSFEQSRLHPLLAQHPSPQPPLAHWVVTGCGKPRFFSDRRPLCHLLSPTHPTEQIKPHRTTHTPTHSSTSPGSGGHRVRQASLLLRARSAVRGAHPHRNALQHGGREPHDPHRRGRPPHPHPGRDLGAFLCVGVVAGGGWFWGDGCSAHYG